MTNQPDENKINNLIGKEWRREQPRQRYAHHIHKTAASTKMAFTLINIELFFCWKNYISHIFRALVSHCEFETDFFCFRFRFRFGLNFNFSALQFFVNMLWDRPSFCSLLALWVCFRWLKLRENRYGKCTNQNSCVSKWRWQQNFCPIQNSKLDSSPWDPHIFRLIWLKRLKILNFLVKASCAAVVVVNDARWHCQRAYHIKWARKLAFSISNVCLFVFFSYSNDHFICVIFMVPFRFFFSSFRGRIYFDLWRMWTMLTLNLKILFSSLFLVISISFSMGACAHRVYLNTHMEIFGVC